MRIYSRIDGKIIDINPDILDNPSLVNIAPYERGWILTIEPFDLLQASKNLLRGRSAKEWLKLDLHRFYELIEKETNIALSSEDQFPDDFPKIVDKNVWRKIEKMFFMHEGKKKRVKLYGIDRVYSTLRNGSPQP